MDEAVRRESDAVLRGLFAVLDEAFWISHPDAIKIADNKLAGLKKAASLGLAVPRTLVTNDAERVQDFYHCCNGQMVIKLFRGWSGEWAGTTYAVLTNRVEPKHLERLDAVKNMPCLLQEYVPKELELRVTVIGREVFAAEIHSQQSEISRDDWRRYDFENTPYLPHSLPSSIESACRQLLDGFGLAFGAIDMILTPEGEYVFLELNANGQWLWIEELTGLPLVSAMADLLERGSID